MKKINPKSFWEGRFRKYGKLSTGYTDKLLYVFDDLLRWKAFLSVARPRKGQKILDAGCNHGAWSLKLARLGFKVTGFDISSNAINEAKKLAKKEKLKIKFSAEKAEDINFKEKFDIIVSVTMMQHIMEDRLFLEAAKKYHEHLADNGKVVLIESASTKAKKEKLDYKRERTFKRQVELFDEAGFVVVKSRGIDFLSYKWYWGIDLLPMSLKLKRIIQAIGLAIFFIPDLLLSKIPVLTKLADLKLMEFKKK